jgi:NitT/TauT family transport system substrate-binding protein
VTHAQPLIGQANGWFTKALGSDAVVEWKTFNAGPAEMQALFAGELDLGYIGPGPAINGYVKSKGHLPVVIAGAADGGAALVVRPEAGIRSPADFRGKRIATPQIGNTQDIAFRGWLKQHGLAPTERGGDVNVMPFPIDQLTLFRRGQIDGAWAPDRGRLVSSTRAAERSSSTSAIVEGPHGCKFDHGLIAHPKFLQAHPELVRRWVAAHVELTTWITNHSGSQAVSMRIKRIVESRFLRRFWTQPGDECGSPQIPSKNRSPISAMGVRAGHLGRHEPDLSGLIDTRWLPAKHQLLN